MSPLGGPNIAISPAHRPAAEGRRPGIQLPPPPPTPHSTRGLLGSWAELCLACVPSPPGQLPSSCPPPAAPLVPWRRCLWTGQVSALLGAHVWTGGGGQALSSAVPLPSHLPALLRGPSLQPPMNFNQPVPLGPRPKGPSVPSADLQMSPRHPVLAESRGSRNT